MHQILLLQPTTSYRNDAFEEAAQALGVNMISVANNCHQLAPAFGLPPILAVEFDQPQAAAATILEALAGRTVDAVISVDDTGVELAALLGEKLGLPANSLAAVRQLRDKLLFRQLLRDNGLNCPAFCAVPGALPAAGCGVPFPVVVKARRLSASRGVVRANNPAQLARAVRQVREIQAHADRDAGELGLLIEAYIPGAEFALEGLLEDGRLHMLALFDKPDPLEGPYFQETIYATPSGLVPAQQQHIRAAVEAACRAAGVRTGPVHAEMRLNDQGVWLLEVAARSIGGLCGRVFRHLLGMSLEELIIRQALGEKVALHFNRGAYAVMMIPIPATGLFHGVGNLEQAKCVPGITDIAITAQLGQWLAPPPEGNSYLGFIFAEADTTLQAVNAVRQAHQLLDVRLQPTLPGGLLHNA